MHGMKGSPAGRRRPTMPVLMFALVIALVLGALIVERSFAGPTAALLPDAAAGAVRLVYGWSVIVALLGLACRYLNRNSRVLAYLGAAMLPYYFRP